jgi:hypothetical protein
VALNTAIAPRDTVDLRGSFVDELRYSADSLVLVAGIPGAGKSTLLRRLFGAGGGVRVLDAEQLRDRWRPVLGSVPYRWWRPLLHLMQYRRVLAAIGVPGPLVVHDCATRPWVRRLLGWRARRCGREVSLLLLDVSEDEARAGQRVRGRIVGSASFATHCRRWRGLLKQAADSPDRMVPGAASAVILDRRAADKLHNVTFE